MAGRGLLLVFLVVGVSGVMPNTKQGPKSSSVSDISDYKEFRKILRTKNNVLVCFVNNHKQSSSAIKVFKDAADIVKAHGKMLIADCAGEAKKMCKKLKIPSGDAYSFRHFKDGEFHKVYDRRETVASMVNFMRDPSGDVPWEEEEGGADVVHLPDPGSLARLIKKESRGIMVMFYAPWCGFCKQLKPEFTSAATTLKNEAIMAAIDVNRPENYGVRSKYNISGFPTLLFFEGGELKYTYEGENKVDELVKFMRNPAPPTPKPKELEWSDVKSEVVHLNTDSFDTFLSESSSTLVMFYAPWCGHCKKMKPEYEKAAEQMKVDKVDGALAALDATKNSETAKKFGVKSYPTIKYFKGGEFQWDMPSLREAEKIVEFMKDPKEPPPPPPPEPDWEDQPSEVVHLNVENFKPVLKKKRHALVMFYAPWCGHCKMAKPEFQAAADESKDNFRVVYAAVDCTKHSPLCNTAGVSGYPTFKYYHYYNKETTVEYKGGRKKADFLAFMAGVDDTPSPTTPPPPPPPPPAATPSKGFWDGVKGASSVTQLQANNYRAFMKQHDSLIVFFYSPKCAQCISQRSEVANIALKLPQKLGVVASYEVGKGDGLDKIERITETPALVYFRKGKKSTDLTGMAAPDVLSFMKDPQKGQKKKKEEL